MRHLSSRLIFIMSVVVCALLLAVTALVFKLPLYPKASVQQPSFEIINETESLQITSARIGQDDFVIEFKNAGTQPIIGYQLEYGIGGMTVDFTTGYQEFNPGQTYTFKQPTTNLQIDGKDVVKLKVKMAYFADDSSEGDWKESESFRGRIQGRRMAIERIKPLGAKLQRADQIESFAVSLNEIPIPDNLTEEQKRGFVSTIELWKHMVTTGVSGGAKRNKQDDFQEIKKFTHMQDLRVQRRAQ
jgi:hypothetical protein